jgi:hypothetical protein
MTGSVIATDALLFDGCCQTKLVPRRQSIELPKSTESSLLIHHFCRKGVYPGTTIQRQKIDDSQVPWMVELPE